MMKRIVHKVIFFLVLIGFIVIRKSTLLNEKALIAHLLKNTSVETRPVKNLKNPVVVTVGIELIQMVSLNEREQYIKNKVWMRLFWTNELMRWKPSMWGNMKTAKISPTLVWKPDIYLYDNIGEDLTEGTEKYKTFVIMESNGKHKWLSPVLFTSSCVIDVKQFPFDYQTCNLKFGSWTSDGGEIGLKKDNRPVVTANYVNSSEWTLLGVEKTVHTVLYNCCPNPYVDIEFTLKLKRKPSYYFFNVIVPCFILISMILFSFFLPPNSGERISLVITVVLAFAVFLQLLSGSLPRNSDSTPLISVFCITVMAEVAVSLVATCFILVVYHRSLEKWKTALPNWVRKYILCIVAKVICIPHNFKYNSLHKATISRNQIGLDNIELDNNHVKDLRMNGVNNHVIDLRVNDVNNHVIDLRKNGVTNMEDSVESMRLRDTKDTTRKKRKISESSSFNVLLDEVSIITSAIHDQNRQDEIEEEWQVLTKVLDRLFFFIFLLTFLVTSAVILLPVYIANK